MSPAQHPQGTCGDDIRLLLADLAGICGTLSEIATIWRRASPYLPGVPAILSEQLHDAARQLAARRQDITTIMAPNQRSCRFPLNTHPR
jgi:hypothetical protein